jgi:predicted Fe-Mo cluster-binding NifX family protein
MVPGRKETAQDQAGALALAPTQRSRKSAVRIFNPDLGEALGGVPAGVSAKDQGGISAKGLAGAADASGTGVAGGATAPWIQPPTSRDKTKSTHKQAYLRKGHRMKIAISTTHETLDADFEPRFGRTAYFCIVDTDTGETASYPNPAIASTGGAGVQAAQFIAEQGVKVVISGNFGTNAYKALQAANIRTFLSPGNSTLAAQDLLVQYQSGLLQEVTAPTHAGHHSSSPRGGRH